MTRAALRAVSRALLLVLGVTTLGPVLHGAHDPEHQAPVVVHDESQHHLQAAPQVVPGWPDGEHCVACHFARSLRSPVAWDASDLHTIGHGRLLSHTAPQLVAAASATPAPSRAPPAIA
ncbi:MAG: hypothetical protein ACT4QD_09160 [Acidobacteriota bacterium]